MVSCRNYFTFRKQKQKMLFNLAETFEVTSRQHEKRIVIDLYKDRLILFIGTYFIGLLAIATVIFVIIGKIY